MDANERLTRIRRRYLARQIIGVSLLLTLLGAGVGPSWSATYYVRTDGGTARQCDGLANHAYQGRELGQACAWVHPFIALPPGDKPRISGGDTLVIGAGDYRMGIGAPGSRNCHPAYSWDCHMPALPAGPDAEHPTRILGNGFDAGCPAPPVFWGTERAAIILNLEQTNHAEIACLEMTDRSSCIEFHCHAGNCTGEVMACERSHHPFGDWASTGIYAADASDVLLADIHIHGLAGRGIQAGRVSDLRLERVRILANGWAGWDGDIGSDSANDGTLYFEDVEIAFNGCAESWPEQTITGCWAQAAGGYGDGLGTARTGGDWVFERASIHHNTSDGLDLAYLDATARVTVNASLFEGNAGNQVKIAASALISNSVVIGSCAHFNDNGNFADWDHCRAGGDAVFLGVGRGIESRLVHNSITGEGNCLVSSAGEAGGRLTFVNNLFFGQPARSRNRQSCHFYSDQIDVDVTWRSNLVVDVYRGVCSPGNLCAKQAGIRHTDIDQFDPAPLPDSPLIGAAGTAVSDMRVSRDFRGLPRPQEASATIGAIEPLANAATIQELRNRLRRRIDDIPPQRVGQDPHRE